jgi:uncharacterized SAM-binding protein YcdF (DUF218 family)
VSHRTAIVVPGQGALGPDGSHRISETCLLVVAEAERVAKRLDAQLVVFSGWSSTGGASEAEQMRDAWRGPPVELLVETSARFTAENASRTLPLLAERGIEEAVVVCSPPHALRARLFFGRLYRARGIVVRLRVARIRPTLRSVVWELSALPLVPLQLRAARADLERRKP